MAVEPGLRERDTRALSCRNSFTNQTMAQIELYNQARRATGPEGQTCSPSSLDEKVARLDLEALGVHLTTLSAEAGRLHRRPGRRPVQARLVPLLRGRGRHRCRAGASHG